MLDYTLGNLRPELRSTHRAIQLVACVPCSFIDKYGFQSILKPFIDDVNVLSKVIIILRRVHLYIALLISCT